MHALSPRPFSLWSLAVWLAFTTMLLATAMFEFSQPIDRDVSTFIYNARQYLFFGKIPYVDILDINPPMSTWLFMPPVWITHKLGLSAYGMVQLCITCIFIMVLAALAFNAHVLRRGFVLSRAHLTISLLVFSLMALPGMAIGFGQREHLIFLFILPQILLSCRAAMGLPTLSGIWLLAATLALIGIGMKPHYILPLMLAEIYVLWQRRSLKANFRPETWLLLALGLTYGAIVLLVYPELFTNAWQVGLRYYGGVAKLEPQAELINSALFALLLGLRFIYGRIGKPQQFDGLLIGAIGCYLAYLLQQVGFIYQRAPFQALAILWIALAYPANGNFALIRQVGERYIKAGLLALAAFTTLALAYYPLQRAGAMGLALTHTYTTPEQRYHELMTALLRRFPDARNVFFMSGQIWAFPTVVYENVDVSCRWGFLWLVPAELRMPPDERGYVARSTAEDFARYKPDIVLVDTNPLQPGLPINFRHADYLSQWPEFAKQWSHYEIVPPDPTVNQGSYVVYRRKL